MTEQVEEDLSSDDQDFHDLEMPEAFIREMIYTYAKEGFGFEFPRNC
jgi:hypothetical protein